MIYQRFGQGVSNLSTVAELRTFDGSSDYNVWAELAPDGGAQTYRAWSLVRGVGEAGQTSPSFPCWRLLVSPDALQGRDTSTRDD
jgi:hypothetical protein